MFSLFKSFFGADTRQTGNYPRELLERAANRALDGVDSRLQALPGSHARLKPSMITAIDHVVELVDQLPDCIDAGRSQYKDSPYLRTVFASADDMQHFFNNDRELAAYLENLSGPRPDYITALLAMNREEKRVFGVEMDGEVLRRDVAQMTVNFTSHRLMDVSDADEETRRLLKRRAFDHLITLALHDVMESREVRLELEQQYRLFRRKLETFEAEGWGFDATQAGEVADHAAAKSRLEEIEAQLKDLPAKTELLSANLDILIKVFSAAAKNLYSRTSDMIVDRMNIIQQSRSEKNHQLTWHDIHSANGAVVTVCMVRYPTAELTPKKSAQIKPIYP